MSAETITDQLLESGLRAYAAHVAGSARRRPAVASENKSLGTRLGLQQMDRWVKVQLPCSASGASLRGSGKT